jgi:hypothetical protein
MAGERALALIHHERKGKGERRQKTGAINIRRLDSGKAAADGGDAR